MIQSYEETQPIIFEEIFALQNFPQLIQELEESDEVILESKLESKSIRSHVESATGLHLLIMCHGF